MAPGDSPISYPSSIDEHINQFTQVDYWANYDWQELVEDVKCTTYSNYDIAKEIIGALWDTSEDEGITCLDFKVLRQKIILRYSTTENTTQRLVINYEGSTEIQSPSQSDSDSSIDAASRSDDTDRLAPCTAPDCTARGPLGSFCTAPQCLDSGNIYG